MTSQATAAMHDADAATLRAQVVECTREAFAAYSIDVDLDEGDPCPSAHKSQIVAFISFGGARLRGTLTVMAPKQLWQRTYPSAVLASVEQGDTDLLDWCGEVVNQVLGRIKNKLARRGVEFQVSTPSAVHASELTISRSAQRSVSILRARSERGWAIGIWFDAAVEAGEMLIPLSSEGPAGGASEESMTEGDLLLF